MQKIPESILLQNLFLNVNRKRIYFIWMILKSRKAQLKQRDKVSLAKLLTCFVMIVATIQDLFSKTQNHIFLESQRIKTLLTLHRSV